MLPRSILALGCAMCFLAAMNPVHAGSTAGQPPVHGPVLLCERIMQHQHRVGDLLWPGSFFSIGPIPDTGCAVDAWPFTADESTQPGSDAHE
jgi:hypothetical protein